MNSSMIMISLVMLCMIQTANAFEPCVIISGKIQCNATQYHGRCGTLYRARSENWCSTGSEDVCCGFSIEDCCVDSGAATVGAILLICLLSVCCLSLFCVKRWPYFCWRMRGQEPPPGAAAIPPIVRESSEQRREALARENANLDYLLALTHEGGSAEEEDLKDCIVCFERKRDVLLPCGHSQICTPCAEGISRGRRQCPTCRAVFHVFRSVKDPLPSFRELRHHDEIRTDTHIRTLTSTTDVELPSEIDLASSTHDPNGSQDHESLETPQQQPASFLDLSEENQAQHEDTSSAEGLSAGTEGNDAEDDGQPQEETQGETQGEEVTEEAEGEHDSTER